MSEPRVAGRMVRAFLRYLRERVGEAGFEAVMRAHPLTEPAASDWLPISTWLPVIDEFERRFGDPATLRLVREMTRSTMASAISKGWSAFLSGATPDSLLAQTNRFWSLSYDAGKLVVASRGPKRVVFAVEDWPSPPPPPMVCASVAEAVAVFLARLGERAPRAVDRVTDGRAEIELTW
jgi:hypothetical protein